MSCIGDILDHEEGKSSGALAFDAARSVGFTGAEGIFLTDEIGQDELARARRQARAAGVSLRHVLFTSKLLSKADYIKALARFHGLPCLSEAVELEGYTVADSGINEPASKGKDDRRGLMTLVRDGQELVVLDVLYYSAEVEEQFFTSTQFARGRLALITPELAPFLRQQINEQAQLRQAIHGLERSHPGFCAQSKTTLLQKLVFGCLSVLLIGGLIWSTKGTLYVLGAGLNLLFLYAILLRFYAVMSFGGRAGQAGDEKPTKREPHEVELPVYTLLVPLFHEHRVMAQLVGNLLALDYPRERLDIKLIFEQGDTRTYLAATQALQAHAAPSCFELVVVPQGGPQTKPKALNFALATARGRYVVVYDAEDQPEPDQLRKAVHRFAQAEFDQAERDGGLEKKPVACLQAGLNHYNIDENWLARQFTIEYTALFDGLLPALQQLELPIMLGGTSNHFRTDILREIGAWDAFNVTEDADLGIRLMRFGYRCEMLNSTTYEEACCRPGDWIRQRTRWLKGWLQTWLVHMRRPVRLFKSLGARGFAGFQIILGAQVLSLVAHPFFILFMLYEAWSGHLFARPYGIFGILFWGLALVNFVLGYGVAIWLGFATLRQRGFYRLMPQLFLMPLYWLLISFATFRALVHYCIKPFHWEKTEHGLSKKRGNKPV